MPKQNSRRPSTEKKKRVVVGLSGGVDSSVSAYLLLKQGYDVIGVFMKNWDESDPHCPAAEDASDARAVAEQLGIPFYTFNFSKEYWDNVFAYFLSENKAGRTPNPDILCNKYVKFGAFLDKATELEADFIATGHYARKGWNEDTQQWELHIPSDTNKDQTYFLYTLTQAQLARTIFPLQDVTKPKVRQIAQEQGFATATKKDSVGICMVGDRQYSGFLKQFLKPQPGAVVEADSGQVLGEHEGLSFYTIGQRRELGIGGVKGFPEAPWFVVRKDFKTSQLVVSQDEAKLLSDTLTAHKLHWIAGEPPAAAFTCEAKIRYRSEAVPCTVTGRDAINRVPTSVEVRFESPVRAITPGQSVVLYRDGVCLGGGEIG